MTNNFLNVWYNKTLVGMLWANDKGILGFKYDEAWLTNGFAISQQLSFENQEYPPTSNKAQQFFANLLPEAGAREHIVRDLKITDSDFELLKAIGGECAGAFSILPVELQPRNKYSYKKLSKDQFNQVLQRRGIIFNFSLAKNRPRLSLAGAQDKCPIFFDGVDYFLPEDASPSTHILKFEISGYKNIPIYEYALTMLAQKIGLPVIDIQLHQYNRFDYLLIKRYDRFISNKEKIERLHQEDFCQALGINHKKKYQQEGGPSFQDCFQLIQKISTKPIEDSENLIIWQIFNVLTGNSDGHAKNLSLLYDKNHQPQLAPFYDLVCTRAIERIDTKLALSVGSEFNPDKISIKNWEELANACYVNKQYLMKLIQKTAEALLEAVSQSHEQFNIDLKKYPMLQRVKKIITKQCKKILGLITF